MPSPWRIDRLITGNRPLDSWIDYITNAIEVAQNITGGSGVDVRRSPTGVQVGLNLPSFFAIAVVGGTAISARSGSAIGSGSVTLQSITASGTGLTLASTPTTVTAYNLGQSTIASGKLIVMIRIMKWWFSVWEDCSTS